MMLNTTVKRIISFVFISLFSNLIQAQEVIPFRLTKYNNIIVKALVNNKDSMNLMFQIAMEDASISPERINPAKSIVFKNEISEGNSLKIGNLEWANVKFYDNELTGQEADGKIGTGLFKGKNYQIDYDHNQFVIYDELPDLRDYQKVPYNYNKHRQIFIICGNMIGDKLLMSDFLLQSGYSGGLLYNNEFADSNNIDQKLKIIGEKTLKNSANQSITTKQGVLSALLIGNLILKDVSAGFFTGEIKRQQVSYLGADLIKRFNWLFDVENQIAYIKPSKYYNEPYFKMN